VVTDDFGAPVEGASVRLLQESGGDREVFQAQLFLGGAFRSARTDATGIYRITGIPSGGYTVIAEKRGHARAMEDAVYVKGETAVDLRLIPAATLRGRVVDNATGRPVVDYAVGVSPRERDVEWGIGLETVSDVDGAFVREDLEPGTYEVEVRASGFGSARMEIELRPGTVSEPVIALERAGRLVGVVRDAATGEPVAGATVALAKERAKTASTDEEAFEEFIRDTMLGEAVETDAEGAFVMDTVPPGEQTIVVNHDSYVQLRQTAPEVRRGEEQTLELVLSTGRKITGTTRTPSGAPSGVRYLMLRGDDDAVRSVRKGVVCMPDGAFTISGLEPGAYRIFAAGSRSADEGVSIEVGTRDLEGIVVPVAEESGM
jgi:hypothetical protein